VNDRAVDFEMALEAMPRRARRNSLLGAPRARDESLF